MPKKVNRAQLDPNIAASLANRAADIPKHDPDKGIAYREHAPDRDIILHLVDSLIAFEAATNPLGPFPDLSIKDPLARDALKKAGFLLFHTVRWAIFHQVGLALSNTPDSVYQWWTVYKAQLPDITPDTQRASDREHEISGASWSGTESVAVRRALATVIEEVLGFWEPARDLSEALRALELGEVRPVLQAAVTGKHGQAYTLQALQVQALAHVQFRKGFGRGATDALDEVAAALGVSAETLNGTWPDRLSMSVPRSRHLCECARAMGEECQRLSRLLSLKPKEERERLWILSMFGDEALRTLASEYRRAMAHGKAGSKKR